MTIIEQVTNWGTKYDQPQDVLDKAISRATVCNSCEHGQDGSICAFCGCRLIRTAFDERSNPCPLHKFNEEVPEIAHP